MKMTTIAVKVPVEVQSNLQAEAERRAVTVSDIARARLAADQGEISDIVAQVTGLRQTVETLASNINQIVVLLLQQDRESQPRVHPRFVMKTMVACNVVMEAMIANKKDDYAPALKQAWAAAKNEGTQG